MTENEILKKIDDITKDLREINQDMRDRPTKAETRQYVYRAFLIYSLWILILIIYIKIGLMP